MSDDLKALILRVIRQTGHFCIYPTKFNKEHLDALDELEKSGIIEKYSVSHPKHKYAGYIYVKRGHKGDI